MSSCGFRSESVRYARSMASYGISGGGAARCAVAIRASNSSRALTSSPARRPTSPETSASAAARSPERRSTP